MYQDLKLAINNYDIEKVKYFLKSIEEDGNLDDEAMSEVFEDVVFGIYHAHSEEKIDTRIKIVKCLFEVHKQTNILKRLVGKIIAIGRDERDKEKALYYIKLFLFFIDNKINDSDIEMAYIREIFYVLCLYGDIIFIKYFNNYFNNIDINFITSNDYKDTILCAVIRKGDIEVVTYLLKNKADVELGVGNFIATPLCIATYQNKFDIVKLLLEYGAMPNTKERPLSIASNKGNFDIVKILLEYGAIFKQSDFIEAVESKNIEIVKLFMNNFKIDENTINDAFCIESYYHDVECMSFLLENGAKIDSVDKNGNSTLSIASYGGKIDIVKILVKHKANIELKNNFSNTPLLRATLENNIEVVEFLVKNGADINIANNFGITPLMRAVLINSIDLVESILKYDVDINKTDKNGKKALDKAIDFDYKEIVKLLAA